MNGMTLNMQIDMLNYSHLRRAWRMDVLNLGKALHDLLQVEILNWKTDWLMLLVKFRNYVLMSGDQACPYCTPSRMPLQIQCRR
jgi:hypothetical protein